jgi:hypothetical protein
MRILLSLSSAPAFVKGDRVAFRAAKDEWYIGTVTSVRIGKVSLLFDDGVKGAPAVPTTRSWKKISSIKKFKKALTDEAATKLFEIHAKKVTKSPNVPVSSPVKLRKDVPEERITSEEQHLTDKLSFPREYSEAQKNPAQRHRYMQLVYSKANSVFFNMKLPACLLYVMKNMGTSFKGRGVWKPGQRKLGVSARLFLANEAQVITTIVHEMCHQAVSEIDKVVNDGHGGHGPHWNSWMRKCGLTPSRYSQYDNETFMTDDERRESQQRKQNREIAKEVAEKTGLRTLYPRRMTPAQYHDPVKNQWFKGLIIDKNDQAGKRWAFLTEPTSHRWMAIPATWFYELPNTEHSKYLTEDFSKAASHILEYKMAKLERRSKRAATNRLYRALLG